jgi:hypothetical protein
MHPEKIVFECTFAVPGQQQTVTKPIEVTVAASKLVFAPESQYLAFETLSDLYSAFEKKEKATLKGDPKINDCVLGWYVCRFRPHTMETLEQNPAVTLVYQQLVSQK